jgi:hypothetical protein
VGDDFDLAIAGLRDLDAVAQVSNTALDLNAVVEELLEGGDIEDLVASGLGSVDHKLYRRLDLIQLPNQYHARTTNSYLPRNLLRLLSANLLNSQNHHD